MTELQTGMYEHYKGGLYFVVGVAHHHETREVSAIYYSIEHQSWNYRPLVATESDPDGFLTPLPDGSPRFRWLGTPSGAGTPEA